MIRTVMHEMSKGAFARQCNGGRCPVCGLPARNLGNVEDDSQYVVCRRCGGFRTFLSSGEIDNCCKRHDISLDYGRALISYYIHKEWLELDAGYNDYKSSNIHYATLDYSKLNSFLGRGGPSVSEQISDCMALIGSEMGRNGRYTSFCFSKQYALDIFSGLVFHQEGKQHPTEMSDEELIGQVPQIYLEIVRTLCVSDIDSVAYFVTKVLCEGEGFLDKLEARPAIIGDNLLDRTSFIITPKGWKFLEGNVGQSFSQPVFVAMWFAEFTRPLREVIRKVAKNKGFDPVFVDELPIRSDLTEEQKHDLATNSTIDDMIIANIRRARFVIADLSCFPGEKMTSEIYKRSDGTAETRDIVCAGAYFEAGYATALEKPIIYLVHRKQTPHFDVNHIPYLTWDENALGDLEVALQNGIEARGLSAS